MEARLAATCRKGYPCGYFRVAGLAVAATGLAPLLIALSGRKFHGYRSVNAEYYFCALVAKSTQ
jgi:hypothetical protein